MTSPPEGLSLTCAQVRVTLSARLDGEDEGPHGDLADAHVHGCADCAAWLARAVGLTRSLRVRPTAPLPVALDPEAIVAAAATELTTPSRFTVPQVLSRLAVVAVALLHALWALSVVSQLGHHPIAGELDPDYSRLLIDAATWRFAVAAGLAFAAWRPRSSLTLLVLVGASGAFYSGFLARDIILGTATAAQLFAMGMALAATVAVVAAYITHWERFSYSTLWRAASAQPIS